MVITTSKIETTYQLFKVIDEQEVLKPLSKVNGEKGKFIQFENYDEGYDGIFPRISDWTRFANRIDEVGVSAYLTWAGNSKLKFDSGYCTVVRNSSYCSEATLIFKNPIQVVLDYLNDQPIIIDVNRITGEFTYEWYWLKQGRQEKIANGIEIYFNCRKYYHDGTQNTHSTGTVSLKG